MHLLTPYEWVHGRDMPKAVYPTLHAAHAAVARLWNEDYQACSGAFYLRSVPSVILHTRLGAVMVVDMWVTPNTEHSQESRAE